MVQSTNMPKPSWIQTVAPTNHRSYLIHGPSGSGKTHLVGTANTDPRTGPLLHLAFESGTTTLVGSGVDSVEIRDWEMFNKVYAYLAAKNHPYRSVALDSISEVHLFAVLSRAELRAGRSDGTLRADPDLIQQDDYGAALNQMRRFLRAWRDLDIPYVFALATSRVEVEPKTGQVMKPSLQGQLTEEVVGMFEGVFYLNSTLQKDSTYRRSLVLQGDPRIRAKVRTTWTQSLEVDEIVDPSITKLLDTLQIPTL